MQRSLRVVALALSTSVMLGIASAQQGGRAAGVQAAAVQELRTTPAKPAPDTTTVALLRAQNALMRDYNASLLATVYWSLGGLGVIAGLLVGFGWFANFKVYERDKVALRQELLGAMREEASSLRGTLTGEVQNFSADLSRRFDTLRESSTKAGAQAAESVQLEVRALGEDFDHRFLSLEYKVAEMEANNWRERKVFTNEIRAALVMLELAGSLKQDFRASRALDRLRNALKAGARPDADLAKDVVTALDRLSEVYVTEVEGIKGALRAARDT